MAKKLLPHEPEQFLVLGQVQAGLRGELEGPAVLLEPRAELPQERLQRPAVPDQVVVHEVDVPPVPERVTSGKRGAVNRPLSAPASQAAMKSARISSASPSTRKSAAA
jgi:hypothetical protein